MSRVVPPICVTPGQEWNLRIECQKIKAGVEVKRNLLSDLPQYITLKTDSSKRGKILVGFKNLIKPRL